MKAGEENLKKKLKLNTLTIVILLVILLIVLCFAVFRMFSVTKTDGTNNNNDSNMGIALQKDDITFYYNYNNGLVRKEKDKEKTLTKSQAYSINYINGMIYFTSPNSTGGIDIKQITEDGKDEKVLVSTTSSSTKMYIQDSKIYYLTSKPDTISKIDLDGKNSEVILQRSVTDFKVIDDTIYFSDIMGYLYSVDTDGENYKTIIKKSLFDEFQILDNYVYCYDNENSKLIKTSLKDISKTETVTDKLDCDTYNVTSNGIYYLDKENFKIVFVSKNGKKTRDIVTINTDNTKINVVGTVIYYIDVKDEKSVTKVIGTNGKAVS